MAVAALVAVLLFVRETNPRNDPATVALGTEDETRRALLSRAYLGNLFAFSLSFAMMMAYISASPFLFQTVIGLGEVEFGLVFGVTHPDADGGRRRVRATHPTGSRCATLARWGLTHRARRRAWC